jgi:superfamily I DNA/RNA helicase
MNLLNLILIVLIITIQPFIRLQFLNFLNNGLVFIKPENLSKTELVERFKELSSSKSLNDLKNIKSEDKKDDDKITIKDFLKSNYFRLSAFILKYKKLISFMNKIALFTILIKYLRKIKLMSFIIRIINYIFLSTFGIFITDIYGLKEVIAGIEYY